MKKNRAFTRLLVALLAAVLAVSCIGVTAFAAENGRGVETETIKVRFYYYQDSYVEESLDVPKGATSVTLEELQELAKEVGKEYSGYWEWFIRDEYTLDIKTDKDKNVKYVSARIEFGDPAAKRKIHVQYKKVATDTMLPQTNDIMLDSMDIGHMHQNPSDKTSPLVEVVGSYWVEGLVQELYGWELADYGPYKIENDTITVGVKAPRETIYVDFKIEINAGGTFASDASRKTINYAAAGKRIITLPTVKADAYHTFNNKWQVVGEDYTVTGTEINLALIPGWPEGSATRLITLSPIFESKTIEVTFTSEAGKNGTLKGATEVTMKPGDIATPPKAEPATGLLFKDWYVYATAIKVDRFDYDTLYKLRDTDGKLHLVAIYEKPPIPVKFNVGKGTWKGVKEYALHEGEFYTIPTVTPPKGQVFVGWYWGDQNLLKNGATLGFDSAYNRIKNNKDYVFTLTAKYAKPINVKINLNGGQWKQAGSSSTVQLNSVTNTAWTLPETVKSGNTFRYWSVNGGKTTFGPTTTITFDNLKKYGENITLEAVWVKDTSKASDAPATLNIEPEDKIDVFFEAVSGYDFVGESQFVITDESQTILAPGLTKRTEPATGGTENAKGMGEPGIDPEEEAKLNQQNTGKTEAPAVPEGDFLGWVFEHDEEQTLIEAGAEITVEQLVKYIGENEDTIVLIPVFGTAKAPETPAEGDAQAADPAKGPAKAPSAVMPSSGTGKQNKPGSQSDGALHLDGETGEKLYGDWFNIGGD